MALMLSVRHMSGPGPRPQAKQSESVTYITPQRPLTSSAGRTSIKLLAGTAGATFGARERTAGGAGGNRPLELLVEYTARL